MATVTEEMREILVLAGVRRCYGIVGDAEVTRAWSEWLAADRREGNKHYRRYVCALPRGGLLDRSSAQMTRRGPRREKRHLQEFHSWDVPVG